MQIMQKAYFSEYLLFDRRQRMQPQRPSAWGLLAFSPRRYFRFWRVSRAQFNQLQLITYFILTFLLVILCSLPFLWDVLTRVPSDEASAGEWSTGTGQVDSSAKWVWIGLVPHLQDLWSKLVNYQHLGRRPLCVVTSQSSVLIRLSYGRTRALWKINLSATE